MPEFILNSFDDRIAVVDNQMYAVLAAAASLLDPNPIRADLPRNDIRSTARRISYTPTRPQAHHIFHWTVCVAPGRPHFQGFL